MKKHAPATLRNREAILEVLRKELPENGTVLEIAAGSGEHAVYFAGRLPALDWQPSDPDPEAIASIAAYREDYPGENLRAPLELDASAPDWPVAQADAIVCCNMVHISPWEATEGLFAGAARILSTAGSPLVLYGPFFEQGIEAARSNLAFDAGLRDRNAQWGIRTVEAMDALAERQGLARSARRAMPANNLTLVYRRP
ncbi:MAG: DUF938 domain-containing protein [Erythrobacter sp.]|uniref:DUF938 domain-containing protein n=1 Tax=Erythrobacter sp. TaxID=1042 RepID=UPI002638DF31|nr:DUF938 domain-containing protein [Erythrobacter sp.]MDJ0976989.1 DUF938 domain-containing protein [Erythrobacter sp.]